MRGRAGLIMVDNSPRRRRSLIATAVSGAAVAALVAGVAVVSSGYQATRMDLDDGAVWVVNAGERVIGRANPAVLELNTIIPTGSTDPQIVQDGSTVLLVDPANATLDVVDPATAELGERVALPPDDPDALLAGDRAVLYSRGTGEVWILGVDELDGFDSSSTPSLSLGADARLALAPDGTLVAAAPDLGEVYRLNVFRSDSAEETWPLASRSRALQVAISGAHWAVLDATGASLQTDTATVDLSGALPGTAGATLQESSLEDAGGVLVADSGGLVRVAPDGTVTPLVEDATGTPAAPLVRDGCVFAAWAGGLGWRACPDADPVRMRLDQVPSGRGLAFAANAGRVVLNAARTGATWAVQDAGQLIDNWDELIVPDDQQQEVVDDQVPVEVDPDQKPPVAVDDEFGARPGRSTLLPVLLNDYDPNADVLVVTTVDGIDESVGRIDLVARNQQIQLTLADSARGQIAVRYTISDGRGGTASAMLRVTVRSPEENSPPVQVRSSTATVAAGGRVTTRVIGDWVDPDGDPFFLTSASTASPDGVSSKPDGEVVFTSGGTDPETSSIGLVMSDGMAEASGQVRVDVRAVGDVPIVIDPWVVLATAGETVTVRPLAHAHGGNARLRLNAVPDKTGVTITPSYENGTFQFTSERIGTHYLEVTLTDGDQIETGLVRVDVSAPPDTGTEPITVPQTAYIIAPGSDVVDPTATDIDPAGGVLVVTGVEDLPADARVRAEILDQREVRITLTGPLENGPVELHYTISNGLADARGTITVVEIPRPAQRQAPIANDDTVTVRTGAVVDIPVLDNDEQPDGDAISLVPQLAEDLPDGAGLLFASGDRLRYLAPEVAGIYTAVYSIQGEDGQTAQARVKISVREVDVASNVAPVPPQVTARVLAGETVRVEIPLSGTDPDGDGVQLVGVATSPEKGVVTATGAGYIDYEAGQYSSGTDSFRYTVVDSLGARAEGVVRVGISPPADGARSPVANADSVAVRPGRTVSVRVLDNDSDPDGRALTVTEVEPSTPDTTAEIVDGQVVRITPPEQPGTYSVTYTIENPFGGTSSTFVTVTVDPDAPLAYPVVGDTVLSVSDVVDRSSVDVDVFSEVFFADGDVSELGISLVDGYAGSAQLLPDRRIRVTVQDQRQIIPFSVSHPDDDSVRSYGFIWVPGYADALPQLDDTAPPLVVLSEDTLTIPINDYVVALGGGSVRLVDPNGVRATHANGDPLVADAQTLVYTSAPQYFGPASITFEVTDGTSADDPDGHRAILSLPITVQPREDQAPSFLDAVVDFEPGQSKELDLVKLTSPYEKTEELSYTIDRQPQGFTASLNGQRLTLTAAPDTPKGTTASVAIGVHDARGEGEPGVIQLNVVASTRPLAQPVPDRAKTRRGQTTTVDVLANDQVNNPFPDTPLRVVAIRGLDGASIPDGVTIAPSDDRSTLTVTVAPGAAPLDTNLQYQVADATDDPTRYVWGNVTISVQDVPDPVSEVRVTEFGDRLLKLSWTPGAANNAPIERYEVAMTSAASGDVISTTTCTTTVDCALKTPGNGPGNGVRLSVVAINEVGPSSPVSNAGGTIWSDIIPPPPTALGWQPVDQGLTVSWSKPADTAGSPIESYVVTVAGETRTLSVAASDPVGTGYALTIGGIPGVANGSSVAYTVSARNSAPSSLAVWNQATGTGVPAWTPIPVASPIASGVASDDGTRVTADWSGVFSDNGRAITSYSTAIRRTGQPIPNCNAAQSRGTSTSGTFSGLTPDVSYTVVVYASNGLGGCSEPATTTVFPRARPGTVSSASVVALDESPTGVWDFSVSGLTIDSGPSAANRMIYRLLGPGVDGSESGVVGFGTPLTTTNGSHYGRAVSVQLKACQAWDEVTLCSNDWSAPIYVGVPVYSTRPGNLTATVTDPGDAVNGPEGDWTWTSSPSGAYDALEYRCDANGAWQSLAPGAGGSCHAVTGVLGGLLSEPDNLQIRITANGTTYLRSYAWADYQQ
ncbi:MAG: tandem-95 repeat protein [Actinomycetales bacterium]|nr:tandem-95 repeat protein [Actinomycetales bacterium]